MIVPVQARNSFGSLISQADKTNMLKPCYGQEIHMTPSSITRNLTKREQEAQASRESSAETAHGATCTSVHPVLGSSTTGRSARPFRCEVKARGRTEGKHELLALAMSEMGPVQVPPTQVGGKEGKRMPGSGHWRGVAELAVAGREQEGAGRILDEAEAAGRLLDLVQPHDDALDVAALGEELLDLLLGGVERQVAHVQRGGDLQELLLQLLATLRAQRAVSG